VIGWDEARSRLVPLVRQVTSPAAAYRVIALDPEHAPVRRRVAPFLHGLLALDEPDVRRFVAPRHLEGWGVSVQDAWHAAITGLDPTEGLAVRPDGTWEVTGPSASSMLLLPGWLAAFAGRVPGEPIAVVPHARGVLVGGAADRAHVDALYHYASRGWAEDGDPISPSLYRATRGGLVPWDPPATASPELKAAVAAADRALPFMVYSAQAGALEDDLDEELVPFQVMVSDDPGPRVWSFVRWVRGKRPLLPEADVVVFEEPGVGAILAVRWGDLVRLAPAALVKTELDPARWRGAAWPDLGELKAVAIPADEI
jgi:hypothetical protein